MHDAIVKAIQKRGTLKNVEYLKMWFYRILINECLGYLRKNRKILFFEEIEDRDIIEKKNDLINKEEYMDLYDA